jgi:integrase
MSDKEIPIQRQVEGAPQGARAQPLSREEKTPRREMKMKRHREQKGRIYRERGIWFLRYYDDRVMNGCVERKRITKRLGEMTKARADRAAQPFLDAVNGNRQRPGTALALGDFVESVYFPAVERKGLRPSTLRGYRVIWHDQLKNSCCHLWLRDVGVPEMQILLDEVAATGRFNKNSMKHIKAFLSGVFKLALQRGYYAGNQNPLEQTSIPQARPTSETYAYTLEEIDAMLRVLPEPASTIVAAASYTGVRRGELRGMYWESYTGSEIMIARSVWQQHVTEPKSAKSKAPVPVIKRLAARLDMLRELQGSPISGPMFPNEAGKAGDLNNLLNRTILPILKRNHIAWHGWHAFRRGLATNLHRLRVDDKTIQLILRHANIATTQNVYIKGVSEDAREGMDKLEERISLSDSKRTVEPAEPESEMVM